MPSLPCAVAFSPVDLKTFGPLAPRSPHFYLVHPPLTGPWARRLVETLSSDTPGALPRMGSCREPSTLLETGPVDSPMTSCRGMKYCLPFSERHRSCKASAAVRQIGR